jgi:pilus assembly protein Flp/PilA
MTKMFVKMQSMLAGVRNSNDEGATAAEYGVLLAGIVGVVAIAALALGGRIGDLFDSVLP